MFSVTLNCSLYFFLQQLFRSQPTQATTPNAAQLQLLQQQQQQYLAQQQQAFPQAPYVLNPQQEPYLIPAGVHQYYNVAPWVYPAPANLIQQGAGNGARRPLTPNGTEAQQQVQVSNRKCCQHFTFSRNTTSISPSCTFKTH